MHPVELWNWLFRQSPGCYSDGVPRYEVQRGGKSVGHVQVQDDHEVPGGSVVEDLYVDPEHRRQGLGRQLLQQAKQERRGPLRIRPRPHRDMAVGIDGLKDFYASEGFKPTGDQKDNMIMDKLAFSSFLTEMMKLAALDPDEQKLYREVARQQGKLDQASAAGRLSEESSELHRVNTERLRLLTAKKRGQYRSIPPWVKDLNAPMPGGSARAGRRPLGPILQKTVDFMGKHPYVGATGAGAVYGGLAGTIAGALSTEGHKENVKKKGGPIRRFSMDHPTAYGAAMGAATLPSMTYGANRGLPGAILGMAAPRIATDLLDLGLKKHEDKEERNRKRREAYAREAKTISVPKPSTGPRVQKPQPAAAPA